MGARSRWKQDRNQDGLSWEPEAKVRAMGLSFAPEFVQGNSFGGVEKSL